MKRVSRNILAAVVAATALQGCITYTDTTSNRDPMAYVGIGPAEPSFPATMATMQFSPVSGLHPHVAYFFGQLCANERSYNPYHSCEIANNIAYQDADVALVSTEGFNGYSGSGGYHFFLLDLHGRAGDFLASALAYDATVTRQGNRITMVFQVKGDGGNVAMRSETIQLNRKPQRENIADWL